MSITMKTMTATIIVSLSQRLSRLYSSNRGSKASAMRRCKLSSHFLTMSIGCTSVTTGLFLCTYNNASAVSLSVAIEVLLQVFNLLRPLNERSHEQDPTGSVSNNCSTVDMFGNNCSLQHPTASPSFFVFIFTPCHLSIQVSI